MLYRGSLRTLIDDGDRCQSFTYICSPQVPLALHTELDGDARERDFGFAIFVELLLRGFRRGHRSVTLENMANHWSSTFVEKFYGRSYSS